MNPDGLDDFFDAPEPSLCDSCRHAYNIRGGSVGLGLGTGFMKTYRQRYCGALTIAIHTSGKQECELHLPVQDKP